jgi:hypothetical protein
MYRPTVRWRVSIKNKRLLIYLLTILTYFYNLTVHTTVLYIFFILKPLCTQHYIGDWSLVEFS